jgi:hypothetical protein
VKYNLLKAHLAAQSADRISMSFAQVAIAARVKLPASAFRYAQWWENDPVHHVQAKAWIEAGYVTEQVDLAGQKLVFARAPRRARGVREMKQGFAHESSPGANHFPLFGWMKGTFTIEPGYDLTRPALDPEEMAEWEASLDRKADRYLRRLNGEPEPE